MTKTWIVQTCFYCKQPIIGGKEKYRLFKSTEDFSYNPNRKARIVHSKCYRKALLAEIDIGYYEIKRLKHEIYLSRKELDDLKFEKFMEGLKKSKIINKSNKKKRLRFDKIPKNIKRKGPYVFK